MKDAIQDPYATMRMLFTTLTQKQLKRAIESLETVVKVRDEDFPELHSLTWDMVRALDQAGMTIGSHTQTHALLTLENPKRMANQVVGSVTALAGKTRQTCRLILRTRTGDSILLSCPAWRTPATGSGTRPVSIVMRDILR